MKTFPRIKRLNRAFSLVEVTLAMGIVGFAAATVLALLPTGLKSLRNSIEQTVESQISQQISSDILQTPFASVGTITKYYDNEGFPVETASEAVFTAEVTPGTVSYPGSEKTPAFSTPLDRSLKSLRVRVTNRASAKGDARLQTSFNLLLARREKL